MQENSGGLSGRRPLAARALALGLWGALGFLAVAKLLGAAGWLAGRAGGPP